MTFRSLRSVLPALCLSVLIPAGAMAAPAPPALGPFIEDAAHYDGQRKCSPWAKPGVVAFQRMVLAAYPGTGEGSISRACSVGGTSEHKEGRAWDWGVNVGVPSERAAANDLLEWLRQEDEYGNEAAMARRLGIMYAIWNKRIWFPGSGWRTYCIDRDGACRDPDDGAIRHPHTDHVHFSFTWGGAKKETTYWRTARSYAAEATAAADGLIVAGRNGGVRTFGDADYHGSKSSTYLKNEAVGIESTPAGDGYWMLNKNGRVFAFGNTRPYGSPAGIVAADMASTSTGAGYWVLGRGGGLFAFGDATELVPSSDAVEGNAAALATTPSGAGSWILHDSGAIESYGDAQHHGNALGTVTDIAPSPRGAGYWVVSPSGQVQAFGDAQPFGGLATAGDSEVVSIVPTPSGGGYWLVTAKAEAHPFGDASPVRADPNPTSAFSIQEWLGTISE